MRGERLVIEFLPLLWGTMGSKSVAGQQPIRFGDGYELDLRPLRLRHGTRILKLERIPLEILALLIAGNGEIVGREEIVSRVWGEGAFLDTDNGIRGAIRKLRFVLKDEADNPRFIETVTGRGYRWVVPVEDPGEQIASNVQTPEIEDGVEDSDTCPPCGTSQSNDEARGRSRRLWAILAAVVVLGVCATILYRFGPNQQGYGRASAVASVAVLPLRNFSGDEKQDVLADAMTEAIISRVSTIRGLRVTSHTSVMRLKGTRMSTPEIARALNVDAIVEGSILRQGNRVRIHAKLIRGVSDEHLWSVQYDHEVSDVFTLQSTVAQAIADRVQATIVSHERSSLISPECIVLSTRAAKANLRALSESTFFNGLCFPVVVQHFHAARSRARCA